MVLLVVLLAASLGAAFVVADRVAEGRAEFLVVHGVVWSALVVGPMYVCGLTNVLTRGVVAGATTVVSMGAVVVALGRPTTCRPRVQHLGATLRSMLLLPADAVRATLRKNGLLAIPLVIAMGTFFWQLVTAYYAPAWGDWDTLWYHEPMVAWSIQNHGFDPVPLPLVHQLINGYQRFGEITQTWWGLFGGRRVLDIANFMYLPMLLGAMHGLASRFTADKSIPIAWAAALLLLPGVARELRSSMVDVEGGALLLAAVYFVSHPALTKRRMVLFLLAVTGAVGTKTINVPLGGIACAIFGVRVLFQRRALGARWVVGLGVLGGGLVLSMLAFTHLRNWMHFGNPLWPISLNVKSLGIRWPGAMPYEGSINANMPLSALLERLLARPYTVSEAHQHTWHVDDFGFGVAWIAFPVGVVACLAAPTTWALMRVVARLRKVEPSAAARRAGWAALVAIFAIAGYKLSPSVHVPRYMIAPLACAFAVSCWALQGRAWRRGLPAVVFTVQISSILMTYWSIPFIAVPNRMWLFLPEEMAALVRTPYPLREEARKFRAPVNEPVALAREKEIGPGDVVMFDTSEPWPAMAWNNDLSNKVYWIDDARDAAEQVEERKAKWVLTRYGSALSQQLLKAGWSLVGGIENEQFTTAYRRGP